MGIVLNVQVCVGKYVTSDSEIQQTDTLGPLVQGYADTLATGSYGWIGDVNDYAIA